jgi:Kef-type K+ transport system membrane component KefB/nucleotide-binding universal stress UspA family protein
MLLSATHNFLSLFLQAAPASGQTPPSPSSEHMVAVFIAEVAVMLFLGRLLGEGMQRIGQPAVMGQLIAGILIGPSVLGTLWPHGYLQLFPDNAAQKKMIDAISQLGILMLLLLTGMETDLSLVNRMRRTALFASISGILFPFTCGFLVGEYMPESLLPNPQLRLATSLFVATALSISSVKIVAMVIMEVGFLRRNVGQIILASAILDDTIGWIIIAIIGGIASGGGVNLRATSIAFLGTIAFLAVCFTLGRKVVAYIIRWTNDNLTIEMPVISAILILMFVAALVTNYIGVHTVLGAFVVGIMVGQSPILTKHIEEELRGLIVALFAPVFFAVAGREIDLTILKSFYLIKLALVFILIASFGKVVGCYLGGRLGGLSSRESTALAIGMNARGSTEVIVATIGLSLGVLSRDLFTLIVVMAIATTLVTPPLLRWALRRIPATGEEKERLEREEAQAKEFVPKIERLLITVDDSADGQLASTLAGLFAGTRQVMTTVLELGRAKQASTLLPTDKSGDLVKASAEQGARSTQTSNASGAAAATAPALLVNHIPLADAATAIKREMEKGYDMLFVGVARTLESKEGRGGGYATSIADVIREFKGASAVAVSKGDRPTETLKQTLNILVPTTGTDYSRRAAEVAVALAKASGGAITALHVSPPPDVVELIRRPRELLQSGRALVREVEALGKREGVKVVPLVKARPVPEAAILRRIRRGRHNLLVLGVKVRPGEKLFFGRRTAALLENAPCSLLIVIS